MTQRFEKQEFHGYHDPDRIMTVENLEFVKCKITGSGFGYRHSPDFSQRSSAKNIRLVGCHVSKCVIGPALLEDIHIENVRGDLIIVWGGLFKHVTIKGRFDSLMLHGITGRGDIEPGGKGVLPYRAQCDEFYETVDWALDIREAEFDDFWIRTRGVPSHLVRRDPETQAVIRREKALSGKWRDMGLCALTEIMFKEFMRDELDSFILVAPKRHKRDFQDVLADIRRLREAGIAEPD
jgi:hypothetical protein